MKSELHVLFPLTLGWTTFLIVYLVSYTTDMGMAYIKRMES